MLILAPEEYIFSYTASKLRVPDMFHCVYVLVTEKPTQVFSFKKQPSGLQLASRSLQKINQSYFCKSVSFNPGKMIKKMHLSGKGVDSIDYGVVTGDISLIAIM